MYKAAAPCRYFGKCGGCQLQDLPNHGDFKFQSLKASLAKINSEFELKNLFQVKQYSRIRANFKVLNKAIAYNYFKSRSLIKIDECLVVTKEINSLIFPINNLLRNLSAEVLEVNLMQGDFGIEIVFKSIIKTNFHDDELICSFAKENKIARIAWQCNKSDPYLIINLAPVQYSYEGWRVNLPIKSFQQVTRESLHYMVGVIEKLIDKALSSVEFFCGAGSFSLPLYKAFGSLTCVEGDNNAVKALKEAASIYKLNIKILERDLFNNPFNARELSSFEQVIINPPRNGASPQMREIGKASSIKNIVMISCDVKNFIRDAQILIDSGFELKEIHPIDQFLYSNHLELIALFNRK